MLDDAARFAHRVQGMVAALYHAAEEPEDGVKHLVIAREYGNEALAIKSPAIKQEERRKIRGWLKQINVTLKDRGL